MNPRVPETSAVEDSVPQVGEELAVGEDLEFQRKWWRFERIAWSVFCCILVCDLLGLFGRGWLARARRNTQDNALTMDYERIERASTPSVMTLRFGPSAIHNGVIRVYVSDELIRRLGAQRISPQPQESKVGDGGITYTFPAGTTPAMAQIALEPSFPGLHHFRIETEGSQPIRAGIFVLP